MVMRYDIASVFKTTAEALESECRPPVWWRAIAYIAAVLPFLFLVALAWLRPEFNRPEAADWRLTFATANAAREQGRFYDARHLYLQVERLSAWHQDWEGLLAAACGIRGLDRENGPYSKSFQILLRALIAAQDKQSRQAMTAVAKAFALMGEHRAADMALAQIRSDWPAETEAFIDTDILLEPCEAAT
jgi:hypothetical protein